MLMKDISIDRVPLPDNAGRHNGRGPRWPWRNLAIGEGFFLPGKKTMSTKYWQVQTGFKFTTRHVEENGKEGVRIWRLR
jgi:hypothetical protein